MPIPTASPSQPWFHLHRRAARVAALALLPLALAACGGSDDDDEVADDTPVTQPTPEAPAPGDTRNQAYLKAAEGDILKVKIKELIPTQPSLGYDQIYYKLGRWQGDFDRPTWTADPDSQLDYINDTVGKKFGDYCEDTGQHDFGGFATIAEARAATLADLSSFQCDSEPGADPDDKAVMKTVVIGYDGNLYLTDGHHSFSALREIFDGGPELDVYVRVSANYSDIATKEAFWQKMVDQKQAWLVDGDNNPITVDQLPTRLGMANDTEPGGMSEDKYRSLVYFTRDIAYKQGDLPEFAEFLWGDWIRRQQQVMGTQIRVLPYYALSSTTTAGLTDVLAKSTIEESATTPGTYEAVAGDSNISYSAAVRDVTLQMMKLSGTDVVYGDYTAASLGHITLGADADETDDALTELDELSRGDVKNNGESRKAGKLWYSAHYRTCGKPAAGTCWGY